MCSSVRMLCVRSASFTRMTRMSRAMATIIFRKFFGLLLFLADGGGRRELRELGDAIDELLDVLAEELTQFGRRREGVLDGVVKQAGHDRRLVELELGQDAGHRQGMNQVRLARHAHLPLMHLGRVHVGLFDHVQVRRGMVGADPFEDVAQLQHSTFSHSEFGVSSRSLPRILKWYAAPSTGATSARIVWASPVH